MQRSIKLWPLIIFFSFDIREFPGIFIMTHQHKILWAINSGWGSLRPPVGSRGNAPVGGEGGCKAPLPKMGFRVFRPLWKPFPVTYYRVYLQVFICRKWVIFPCINADSWEKDVQLHFVSGTKFYNKNICHIVWVYWAWRLSIYFFSLFTLL
jgi:hypothetical protein